jgi:phosphate-selective porin
MKTSIWQIAIAVVFFAAPGAAQSTLPESDEIQSVATRPNDDSVPHHSAKADERNESSIRIGNALRIDFKAQFRIESRGSEGPVGGHDDAGIDVARKRIGIDGALGKLVRFQVETELGEGNPWRDVYVDYHQFKTVQLQAGQFKLPFSFDENTASTNLDFVYRSAAASQLAPGRDRGVMLHGRVWRRALKYEAGVFVGDGDNVRATSQNRVSGATTIAGRMTLMPFVRSNSLLATLHGGIAFTGSGLSEGISGLRGRTALDASFFPRLFWVNGGRRRTGVETRWKPGPFSVTAEYMRVTDERLGQGTTGEDLSPLVGAGWYVSGTWALPPSLFPRRAGRAQLAARFEGLRFGSVASQDDVASISPRADPISATRDRLATIGMNWRVNRWVRLQGNVLRESVTTTQGPLAGRGAFWSRVLRVQLNLGTGR